MIPVVGQAHHPIAKHQTLLIIWGLIPEERRLNLADLAPRSIFIPIFA